MIDWYHYHSDFCTCYDVPKRDFGAEIRHDLLKEIRKAKRGERSKIADLSDLKFCQSHVDYHRSL